MRLLPPGRRQEGRGLDAILSSLGQVTPELDVVSPGENGVMKTIDVMSISAAGILVMVALAAHGQMHKTAVSSGGKSEAVEAVDDAQGNLHVPDAYLATYRFLGSWAIAGDQGRGSKELHVVYASPGAIEAYRKGGHFPDTTVLVKEVFDTSTAQLTTGTVSRADTLK